MESSAKIYELVYKIKKLSTKSKALLDDNSAFLRDLEYMDYMSREVEKIRNPEITRFHNRRAERLKARFDDDGEEETAQNNNPKGGHGNTRLPYGLAKGEGINTTGMTPKEVWKALEGEGYSAGEAYHRLKEGKHGKDLKTAKPKVEAPKREPKKINSSGFPGSLCSSPTRKKLMDSYASLFNEMCKDADVADFIGYDMSALSGVKLTQATGEGAFVRISYSGPTEFKIPRITKADSPEIRKSKLASFVHEYTHLLNHSKSGGKWWDCYTSKNPDLRNTITEEYNKNMPSERAKKLFSEFHKKVDAINEEKKAAVIKFNKEYAKKFYGGDLPYYINDDGSIDYSKFQRPGGGIDWGKTRDYDAAQKYEKKRNRASAGMVSKYMEQMRAAMDGVSTLEGLYDSISEGRAGESHLVYYGHRRYYFKKDSTNAANELLSDFVSLSVINPELLSVFEENYPKTASLLRKAMKEMINVEGKK